MPCDVWKDLAQREKSNRQSYSYFAFNKEMARVSERKRHQLMKEHSEAMSLAGNAKFLHQRSCPICKEEPAANFHDPDPWSKGA
jgi:hypothetical protein